MSAVEVNYDGLVGPTHNYAGLSLGNLASTRHGGRVAHPRLAALQGLAKMKQLSDLGLWQGVLPPQDRPALWRLRELGFAGTDEAILEQAWTQARPLVVRLCSASSMWAANAATVSPSPDALDGYVHVTPANLLSMPHRALEGRETGRALRRALGETRVVHHPPLPSHADFADEGAANHLRLCEEHGAPGIEVFVYGRSAFDPPRTDGFPARQTLEACQALARRAQLDPARALYLRQSEVAIDAGAFHNDVVAVSNGPVLLFHEAAFAEPERARASIRRAAEGLFEPRLVEVPSEKLPIEDAIRSYFFNSQLVKPPGWDRQLLIAPVEVAETPTSRAYCDELVASGGPIGAVRYVDLRQSMQNGGGPACLRLRVVLTDEERSTVNPAQVLDEHLYAALVAWVERHYRPELRPDELGDPALLGESRAALDELTDLLGLGNDFYAFQRP